MNNIIIKNQTLNQEKINKTIPVRKIRIIVSDPYATDSSSDDDYDHRRPGKISSPKRRRIVQEIILPNDDAGEKLSGEGSGEISEANLNRFRGVRRRRGKWSAEIRDPFLKRKVFLGTFGTAEEASRVFEAKKVEFRERQEAQSSSSVDDAGSSGEGSGVTIRTDLKRVRGIYRRKSGSSSAEIGDPFNKRKVFLGTAEDAGEKSSGEGFGGTNRTNFKKFRGVRRRKNGSWSAEILDPFKKLKVFLGVFGTAEEASRAFEAKKVEFRERQDAQSAMDRARLGCGSGTDSSNQSGEQIEAGMILGSILIDHNGFLLGEFSNLDDDLKILD